MRYRRVAAKRDSGKVKQWHTRADGTQTYKLDYHTCSIHDLSDTLFAVEPEDMDLQVQEDRWDIQEAIVARVKELMEANLTPHQMKVFKLVYEEDLTYKEAAVRLGVNYTAIPNSLNGIKKGNIVRGGTHWKMKKILEEDEVYQGLADRLREF